MTVAVLCIPAAAGAQTDTSRAARLDAVVVTADRLASSIAASTSSVSRIGEVSLRSAPVRTVADALRLVPGPAFVDFDGLGNDPQMMMRGFYGGGEAEYVLLLLDGRPLNAFENGRVTWDQIPLAAIESIEIVRGGASAVWGDAALAGVINLRTRRDASRYFQGIVEGGSFGEARASASTATMWNTRPLSAFGSYSASDGFRVHSERTSGGFGGTLGLLSGDSRTLNVTTSHDWRSYEEPGALNGSDVASSRRQSSPFFRFDHSDERTHRAGLDYETSMGADGVFTARLGAEFRHSDRVRTLQLAPDFGDTKERVLNTSRIGAEAQLRVGEFMVGLDASVSGLRSEHYLFTQGDEAAYVAASAQRGSLDARGEGTRSAGAAFVGFDGKVGSTSLRVTAGGRLDWLQDEFEAVAPSAPARHSATHVAFSPKVGLNLMYAGSGASSGHVYVNFGRSFKAPTQDQLFDQRNIPVPFPPFSITFANSALNPQYGTNYEAGLYHSLTFAPGGYSADFTLSVYQMDLRDELDFDIQSFRYENIGRSRHRGIETGVTLHAPATVRVFGNYTLQAPTSRSGDNAGMYLKAIPRHLVTAGAGFGGGGGFALNATLTSASGMFLDDANSARLDSWNRWDLRASYAISSLGLRLFADVLNVLDTEYNTTGFPDPSGSGDIYYYPAAGRVLRFGLAR